MNKRILVAGVGNVFLGDDAFGVEVVRRLAWEAMPAGTTVTDYGIRGTHLALDLLSPPDLLILVDCLSRSGPPGSLYLVDPDVDAAPAGESVAADPHGMDPHAVLVMVQRFGGPVPRTRIVGCEPFDLGEGMGLSEPVRQAIEPAVDMIRRLLDSEVRSDDEKKS
jgi:hydrogenase maturation protease